MLDLLSKQFFSQLSNLSEKINRKQNKKQNFSSIKKNMLQSFSSNKQLINKLYNKETHYTSLHLYQFIFWRLISAPFNIVVWSVFISHKVLSFKFAEISYFTYSECTCIVFPFLKLSLNCYSSICRSSIWNWVERLEYVLVKWILF